MWKNLYRLLPCSLLLFTAAFGGDPVARVAERDFQEMLRYCYRKPVKETPDRFGDRTVNDSCTPLRVMTEEDGLPAEYGMIVELLASAAQEGKLFCDVIDSLGESLKSLYLLCPPPGSENTLNVPNHIEQVTYNAGTLNKLLSDLCKLIDADRHLHIAAFFKEREKNKEAETNSVIGIYESGTPRCLAIDHGLNILQKLEHTRRDLLNRVPIHLTSGSSLGDVFLKNPEGFLLSLGVVNRYPSAVGRYDPYHHVNPYRRFGYIAKHSIGLVTQLLELSPKDASVLDKVSRRYISMLCLSRIVKELDDLNDYYQELSEPERVTVGSKSFKDVLEERSTVRHDVLRFVAESLSDIQYDEVSVTAAGEVSITAAGEVSVTAAAAYSDELTATRKE